MIALIQGGHESEAEISRMTSKSFQEALKKLNKDFRVLEYGPTLSEELRVLEPSSCLLALHGKYGEDGVVQGLLEHLRIPYSGSGIFASSLSFDKVRSLKFAKSLGLPVLPHVALHSNKQKLLEEEKNKIASWESGFVVKPASSGSSRGVSLCDKMDDLEEAIKEARRWSNKILVEKRLKGREITLSLFKGRAFSPIEIRPKAGFYDMKNKYTKGATDYLCPAPIHKELEEKCKGVALKIYKEFGLRTYGRVDFLISQDESEHYFMEVNTLPGCTATSLLPKALAKEGIAFEELIKELVDSSSLES